MSFLHLTLVALQPVWTVVNGTIVDDNGHGVGAGYEQEDLGDSNATCGIKILSVQEQDYGTGL